MICRKDFVVVANLPLFGKKREREREEEEEEEEEEGKCEWPMLLSGAKGIMVFYSYFSKW
jgi:hypothetical protein